MTADHITSKLENIISGHGIHADDADWLRAAVQSPAEGDELPPLPARLCIDDDKAWFSADQMHAYARDALAARPLAPWGKTVESAALLLNRCTQLPLDDCEGLAGTILGMAAASEVQPKVTEPDEDAWTDTQVADICGAVRDHCGPATAACLRRLIQAAQAPAPAPEDVQRQHSTVYMLNERGTNRWWAQVQPGHDDADRRVSEQECEAVAEAIRAGLETLHTAIRKRAAMAANQSPAVKPEVPEVPYLKLIEDAWSRHKYAQGSNGCIAFKRGAEWMREYIVAASQPPVQPTGGANV